MQNDCTISRAIRATNVSPIPPSRMNMQLPDGLRVFFAKDFCHITQLASCYG